MVQMNVAELAGATVRSPHAIAADTIHLDTLARGARGTSDRLATDRMPQSEDDAAAVLTDWIVIAAAEAEALGETVAWAVTYERDGERLGRGPAQRAQPTRSTAVPRGYDATVNGANAILQAIIMKWSDILPAVQLAQARTIDAQNEQLRIAHDRQIDEIRVRERLASKEHEREIEAAQVGARMAMQERAMGLLDEIKPMLGERAEVATVRAAVAGLTPEARAELAEAMLRHLSPEAARAALDLLGSTK